MQRGPYKKMRESGHKTADYLDALNEGLRLYCLRSTLKYWRSSVLGTAVRRFLLQAQQPGTRCQTISVIRRWAKTLLGDH